ncbi:Aromatic-L-amino-acid decarboxylase [Paragonimus heterotremus]|uniref:Aromatic-L-amino-acid decarboxylase n=1 Tax=Paragonimus heterotremus TaxID=100268 RepID=A0A8J4WIQ9_9TREM|nr:Aromatic-L-amino-acid decarboxylase [Paragonimus heterotremus]
MDSSKITIAGIKILEFVSSYWRELEEYRYPVLPDFSKITPGYLQQILPAMAPELPEELDCILQDIREQILPGVTHWQHPNFHAYFPTACSYPAVLGELISGGLGIMGFSWIACPASTELEVVTLNWLAKAIGLPKKFLFDNNTLDGDKSGGGTIETTASISILTIVLSIRDRAIQQITQQEAKNEQEQLHTKGRGYLADRMVVYISDQAHSSVIRAIRLALIQCHCVATLGTTSTCEFDDLDSIGKVCQTERIWLHVDAAYAAAALLCPEFRHLSKGVELSDSFCFNPHKLLMVNFDCSVLWVSDCSLLTETLSDNAIYLQNTFNGMPDYKNWSLSLGRRFRSLKLWFVLRMVGLEELRRKVRDHASLGKLFEKLILEDGRFDIVNEVRFGLVCFKLKQGNKVTRALHDELLRERKVYLVPGSTSGKMSQTDSDYFIRFVCNHQAKRADVIRAVSVISEAASRILQDQP